MTGVALLETDPDPRMRNKIKLAIDSRKKLESKFGIFTYRLCLESKQFIRPKVHMLEWLWHNGRVMAPAK